MKHLSKVFILLICVIYGACKNGSNFSTVCNNVSINTQVDSLLDAIITENEKVECQYFLVTYLSCGERIVTLIANNLGDGYYLRKQSLVYFIRNGKKIYLVTGVEDFFKKESEKSDNKGNDKTSPFIKIKSYVIEKNKIEYIPRGIPPFAPPPAQPDI